MKQSYLKSNIIAFLSSYPDDQKPQGNFYIFNQFFSVKICKLNSSKHTIIRRNVSHYFPTMDFTQSPYSGKYLNIWNIYPPNYLLKSSVSDIEQNKAHKT